MTNVVELFVLILFILFFAFTVFTSFKSIPYVKRFLKSHTDNNSLLVTAGYALYVIFIVAYMGLSIYAVCRGIGQYVNDGFWLIRDMFR